MPRQSVRDFGTCLSFNGSSSSVLCKSGKILAGLTSFTISAWINTVHAPTVSGDAIYCERAATGNDIVKMEVSPSLKVLRFTYRDDAGTLDQHAGAIKIQDGKWHHVVTVKSGSTYALYVDGVLDRSGNMTAGNTMTNAIHSTIGSDTGDNQANYGGLIDDVTLFTTALAQADVTALYYSGIIANGAIDRYQFDEGSGTTATDSIGSNNGTISNATYSSNVFMKARTAVS